MEHKHEVADQDLHFIIDPKKDMAITCEGTVKGLKRGDHGAEVYRFRMPRIIEGHDMSLCNKVEIHYNNIHKDRATREVTTNSSFAEAAGFGVGPDEDTVTWTWKPTGDAAQLDGTLAFCIRFACLEGAEITYQKFTGVYEGIPVGETIHNTEALAREYADVLESWRQEIMAQMLTEAQVREIVRDVQAPLDLDGYRAADGTTIGQHILTLIGTGGGTVTLAGMEGFWAAVGTGLARARFDMMGQFAVIMPATVVVGGGQVIQVCADAITELPGGDAAVYAIRIGIVRSDADARLWVKMAAA